MSNSGLEIIKTLDNLTPYISKSDWEDLRDKLGVTQTDFDARIKGIHRESDFLLGLHMMNVCKNVTLIDESISRVFGTYSCDAIIQMGNGKKFMLEIKHTDKNRFEISGGNLQKRNDYAIGLGLKLYFAISVKGFWMVFDSDYIKKQSGKIDMTDYKNSRISEIFNVQNYLVSNFEFKSVYANRDKNIIEIKYPPYGWLVSEEIKHQGKRRYKIKRKNKDLYFITFALEGIKDRASTENHDIVTDCGFTIITDKFDKDSEHIISELELLLAPIKHMIHYDDVKFTPKNFLNKLNELGMQSPLKVHMLRAMLDDFGLKKIALCPLKK